MSSSFVNPFGIVDLLQRVVDGVPLVDENELQRRLAGHLNQSRRELRMHFNPPALPSDRPPDADVEFCRSYRSETYPHGIDLPVDGWDPCLGKKRLANGAFAASRRRLDILWNHEGEDVALELKYRAKWTGDTYGYDYLKDLHRLERLGEAEDLKTKERWVPSGTRLAVFVSAVSNYWSGEKEPDTFHLIGSRKGGRSMVQYPRLLKRGAKPRSAVTLWHDYVPFYLVNDYSFEWLDLGDGLHRALCVQVSKQ